MKTEEIVYIEQSNLNKEKKKLPSAVNEANMLLQIASKIVGDLEDNEKLKLLSKPVDIVMEMLRPKFLFPNATDKFNLNSLGVDLSELYAIDFRKWNDFDLELNEHGKFRAAEFQPHLDSFVHRVVTDRQKKAVELADKMISLIKELQDSGLANPQCSERAVLVMPNLIRNGMERGTIAYNEQEICKYIK